MGWTVVSGGTLEAFKCLGAEAGNACTHEVDSKGGICHECADWAKQKHCNAPSGEGYVCTRPEGHTGMHVAHYDDPKTRGLGAFCPTAKWWKAK